MKLLGNIIWFIFGGWAIALNTLRLVGNVRHNHQDPV